MFKYKCRGCERVIKLKAEHLGRKLKCKCEIVFRAPEKSAFASSATSPPTTAPKQPSVQVSCPACFTMLQARADLAGKVCKCSCGEKIRVPANNEAGLAQASVASGMDMSDPLALPIATAPADSRSKFQTRYNNPEAYKPIAPPTPKKKVSSPSRTRSRQTSSFLEGPAIGGMGMMLGAVIWFVVGWYAGYIFFYPPILFFIGLGSLAKALID